MPLLREWRRRAFGAAIGTVIAPVAVLAAALAVGFGGGGFAALGSLGQAFAGPRLPDSAPLARARDTRDTGRLLARVRDAAAAPAATDAAATAPAATGTTGGEESQGTGFDPGTGNTPPAGGPAATPPPTVATPSPSTSPPVATESPVRQVGDTVRGVTDRLPVVGAPTGELVDGVVDTIDTILEPR